MTTYAPTNRLTAEQLRTELAQAKERLAELERQREQAIVVIHEEGARRGYQRDDFNGVMDRMGFPRLDSFERDWVVVVHAYADVRVRGTRDDVRGNTTGVVSREQIIAALREQPEFSWSVYDVRPAS